MIELTRLGGKKILINADWLEMVEENPDTTIILASGIKLLVQESSAQVLALATDWRGNTKRKPLRRNKKG